jgi:two-component system phosphate regulon response regulator PhoB
VWGDHVFIEERTVDVHIKRLREALGDAGVMVETVRGAGYRFTSQVNLLANAREKPPLPADVPQHSASASGGI